MIRTTNRISCSKCDNFFMTPDIEQKNKCLKHGFSFDGMSEKFTFCSEIEIHGKLFQHTLTEKNNVFGEKEKIKLFSHTFWNELGKMETVRSNKPNFRDFALMQDNGKYFEHIETKEL